MIPQFNSVVLDVVMIVLLVLAMFFGAVKGIKHTSINLAIFIGSLALAFSPITNVLKNAIIEILAPHIKLSAGMSETTRFGIYLSYMFLASLILMLLIYCIARLFKALVVLLIIRRKEQNNILVTTPSLVSRLFGGFTNLLVAGVVVIFGLSILNHPVFGLDKTLDNGYVAKHVENLDDLALKKLYEEKLVKEKVMVKLIKGDFFVKVDDESAKAFQGLTTAVENNRVVAENLEDIEQGVQAIHDILFLVDKYALDDKGLEVDGFEEVVKMTRNMVTNAVNQMRELNSTGAPIPAKNVIATTNLLIRLQLSESTIETFANTFVENN